MAGEGDATDLRGLSTRGYFGAVFDGRYVYFVPEQHGEAGASPLTGQGSQAIPGRWIGIEPDREKLLEVVLRQAHEIEMCDVARVVEVLWRRVRSVATRACPWTYTPRTPTHLVRTTSKTREDRPFFRPSSLRWTLAASTRSSMR